MIKNDEITFVVQGAVSDKRATLLAISSIRKNFPGSTIILSTWEGSDLTGLQYDELALSRDPGSCIVDDCRNIYYNINRQIVSSREGLIRVKTKYAVKTRTDCYFKSPVLIKKYENGCKTYGIDASESNRILVIRDFFRNPRRRYHMAYHVSDFLFFGKTEDIRTIFSCKLMSDTEIRWYSNHQIPTSAPSKTVLHRFSAEQHLWMSFLHSKNWSFSIENAYDISESVISNAEASYRQFLLIYSSISLDFFSIKHKKMYLVSYDSYSAKEIKNIYVSRFSLAPSFERTLLLYLHSAGRAIKYTARVILGFFQSRIVS
ncbi:WavE lipopolysaccharide synthesis family protein [Noviherbaspirillum sedimenti]|uniref:WavE lipopolysaccharide synthesis n=1 Tax=Noviherbaspirillum sedimenti TaxID=2320865 RepID=A0A3A3G683_9BURK|nr:WavE lipopolysaccharide synthesis family protein [Noviherbaspirillum sedimenti]RJG02042.1 hypothetical protein D3878_11000 [Noviherbaspirillum sedimenti]